MQFIHSFKDLNRVLVILVFLLVFFVVLSPPQDADMWWHLAAGKKMVEQGNILTTDAFSYTHNGEPWTNAFWLSDTVLFLAYRLGGYLGITLLTAFVAVLTMAVVYRHTSGNPCVLRLLIILLGTFAIVPVWTPRPQIFSFLLLAILDYGLHGTNASILKRPWLLIPLFILWANIHGGFIWGFLLLFAFIVGKGLDNLLKRESGLSLWIVRNLSAWTLAGALAIMLNPNGLALWKLPFYTVDISIQLISEWHSPDFHRLDLHPLLWLLFLIILGAGTSKKALSWSSILKVIGFAYMAFVSQRSIGPFVIVAIPVVINSLASTWSEWLPVFSRIRKRDSTGSVSTVFAVTLNLLILAILVGVTLFRAYSVSTDPQVHRGLPRQAVEAIRVSKPQAQMFNSYNWGGYLQWQLPGYPVFIDGRADLYGEQTINDWWSVVNGTNEGLELLDSWDVNFVILEPGWPVLEELTQRGWHVLYKDNMAVVLER
jgi:hypothetical protein